MYVALTNKCFNFVVEPMIQHTQTHSLNTQTQQQYHTQMRNLTHRIATQTCITNITHIQATLSIFSFILNLILLLTNVKCFHIKVNFVSVSKKKIISSSS